jgi:coenzyme F420-reducing hydrogenase delta subunit
MNTKNKPKITIFYCINSYIESENDSKECDLKSVRLACSSMVKDVYLLRAFEAGADAVVVLVCPDGTCLHAEGNIRAKKRVSWIKKLLDEIGINSKRISIHNTAFNDKDAVTKILRDMVMELKELGPSPIS